jgi:hypothetical protein
MDKRKLRELLVRGESEAFEYKGNNNVPERMGKCVSSLFKAATMLNK